MLNSTKNGLCDRSQSFWISAELEHKLRVLLRKTMFSVSFSNLTNMPGWRITLKQTRQFYSIERGVEEKKGIGARPRFSLSCRLAQFGKIALFWNCIILCCGTVYFRYNSNSDFWNIYVYWICEIHILKLWFSVMVSHKGNWLPH